MARGAVRLNTLHWALLLSVGVHALLLAWRVAAPEQFNRVFQDTPLEVILVNARSEQAPDKAQAMAQAHLQGGGEAAQGRATSPLPATLQWRDGDALEPDAQTLQALKQRQEQLLTTLRAQLAALPPPEPSSEQASDQALAREARRQALVNVLGEIERRISEQNARPKKRFVSPATQESVYATYYDSVRRKIEDHGTRNFPTVGGRKLYGELTMVITIQHNGQVLSTEVAQGSGNPVLDRRSEAIVRSLSFDVFGKAMRRQADQIVVVSRFRYARDETLRAQLSAQESNAP